MTAPIEARLRAILTAHMGIANVRALGDDQPLAKALGLDSLDAVELAIAMEDEFGIDVFDDGQSLETHTIADLVAFVETAAREQGVRL